MQDYSSVPAPPETSTAAERWLSAVESDIVKDTWRDPDPGRVQLGGYLANWIDYRPGLRPRTLDLYRWLNRKYLELLLSEHLLSGITLGTVRTWRAAERPTATVEQVIRLADTVPRCFRVLILLAARC